MKKVIVIILAMFFASCESGSHNTEENIDSEIQVALKVLENKGFNTDSYQVLELPYGKEGNLEKMISADGDGLFLIKELQELSRNKQYHTNNLLKAAVAGNLRIALKKTGSNAISNQWITAFQTAIANWNSIKTYYSAYTTYLKLIEVNETDNYDILVFNANLGNPNAIAQAGFPLNNGTAFASIYINTGLVGSLSNSQRIFTATHEMGHSIGFRHTNWFDRNSDGVSDTSDPYDYEGITIYGANHIPNTPTGLDPNSVMNAIVAPWNNFSSFDRTSVRYMYPRINIIQKEFIEYNFYIYKGWPVLKFKIKGFKGPDPTPWKSFEWFYRDASKRGARWMPMKESRAAGSLRLPREFEGKLQLLAIADNKMSYSSEIIQIKR